MVTGKEKLAESCLVVACKYSTLTRYEVLKDELSNFYLPFFLSSEVPHVLVCRMRMNTIMHCPYMEPFLPMLHSSSCCQFFCAFFFCTISGVNNNNHLCPVFLLPFCKELLFAFFERHLQRNNLEECTRNYLLCLEPFHHWNPPSHQ